MNTSMSLFDAMTAADVRAALAAGADIEQHDVYLDTPLLAAIRRGRNEVVRALIAAGANVRTASRARCPPLHAAAYYRSEFVGPLIAAGADVEARDKHGRTPLFRARNAAVVRALHMAGADTEARSDNGDTPLEYAVVWSPWECALALIELGARVSDPRLLFRVLNYIRL